MYGLPCRTVPLNRDGEAESLSCAPWLCSPWLMPHYAFVKGTMVELSYDVEGVLVHNDEGREANMDGNRRREHRTDRPTILAYARMSSAAYNESWFTL